eukprot:NODE_9940_length_1389_cov_4.853407.p1 GENE.NODE_9940_length_1389_cov_4.853407~~NODE_9940_length_1389_cov_4.853407.p1  ORF type:complete len:383 (+),score=61.22 NODE_9940_length_1389_cov_4.853407:191-1339(+)
MPRETAATAARTATTPTAPMQAAFFGSHAAGMVLRSSGSLRLALPRCSRPKRSLALTVQVDNKYFSEGISALRGSLFMLTYREHVVVEYKLGGRRPLRTHSFADGEGWGMTTDGCDILVTTGSSELYRFRGEDFEFLSKVTVRRNGKPVKLPNELEYVNPKVWMHVWQTDTLLRVDPWTGRCETHIDIKGLYQWRSVRAGATPNGVAYSLALGPLSLLVTGKYWPRMFKLTLESAEDLCGGVVHSVPEHGGTCAKPMPSACSPAVPLSPKLPASPEAALAKALPEQAATPEKAAPEEAGPKEAAPEQHAVLGEATLTWQKRWRAMAPGVAWLVAALALCMGCLSCLSCRCAKKQRPPLTCSRLATIVSPSPPVPIGGARPAE